MCTSEDLIGLPWSLVEKMLQETKVSYRITYGASFNKFFSVASQGWYVYRVKKTDTVWDIFLLRPMIYSGYEAK